MLDWVAMIGCIPIAAVTLIVSKVALLLNDMCYRQLAVLEIQTHSREEVPRYERW